MAGEIRFRQPRDAKGRFQRFEGQVRDLMRKEAIQFQGEVASYMRANYKRKRDSTGRLAFVTQNANNRRVGVTSWRVGIPGYLNRSEAKYWRTIEEGSLAVWRRPFRGTPLKFNPNGFPGGRQFRSFPRGSNMRIAPNQALSDRGIAARPFRGVRVVYVRNEIAPMHAYRNTYRNGGWGERTRREFRQLVGRNF